jgi:hypothetical protein
MHMRRLRSILGPALLLAGLPSAQTQTPPRESTHWAFRPIRRPEPPSVSRRTWVRNPIDAFILARLEAEGIAPSPEADRATLIRRVSLDLTGLPPQPKEVREFLADNRPDAYERLVDRLLASPHYGERWARPWLDQARYADSDGYEKDWVRPWAWRYRDWVIGALNRDLPFDRFTIEQIAGDLLPNHTNEQLIATGFHRNTLKNREGGVDQEQFRFENVVDRTNTVGTVWLGLTVGCAQCHDHKYDPVSQKEYYQLFAFFDNLEEVNIEAPLPGEMGPYLRTHQEYRKKRDQLLQEYHEPEVQAEYENMLREAHANPGKHTDWDLGNKVLETGSDGGPKILPIPDERRTQDQKDLMTDHFVEFSHYTIGQKRYDAAKFKELKEKLDALKKEYPQLSRAQAMAEDAEPHQTHLRIRGDFKSKGTAVEPGTLSVLPPLPKDARRNRLALAQWIVSRDNPLAARVAVNRIWQEFFGRGIVFTSEDFGTQGDKPVHPELLDWLAAEFMDEGWSMKQLQRRIVTSATYRQTSAARPELHSRDPQNTLLARQSRLRLPAELIRDVTLSASGLLNPAIGGPSVRPPQPASVASLGYANSVKWEESAGPQRYRRGVYILFQRTTPYPQLITFDAPDSNVTKCRRDRSDTALQALNLLNDPVFFEAAQALAVRILTEASRSFPDQLDYAFALCLARGPKPAESAKLSAQFGELKQMIAQNAQLAGTLLPIGLEGVDATEAAAWVGLGRVLLNLDEFITRE